MNRAIHWNDWANFTKAEMREVVEAFRALLGQLRCSKAECESWLYVMPRKGDPESLRCRCGSLQVNLKVR